MGIFHKSCGWNSVASVRERGFVLISGQETTSFQNFVSISDFCMHNRKKKSHAGPPNPEAAFKPCFVSLVEVEETYLTYSPFLQAH